MSLKITLLDGNCGFNYGPKARSNGKSVQFPLGLLSLGAYLKKHGIPTGIDLLDNQPFSRGNEINEMAEYINRIDADLIGISSTSVNLPFILMALKRVKKSGRKVILGGHGTSFLPDGFHEHFPYIDYLVQGEGELPFLNIVSSLTQNFTDSNETEPNNQRLVNLDEIPPLDYQACLRQPLEEINKPLFLPISSSRGCPYSCVFCATSVFWRNKVSYRNTGRLVDEMSDLVSKNRHLFFVFVDDLFTLNKRRVSEFCDQILKRKLQIQWICFARLDSINQKILEQMKSAGCRLVSFGVESGNDQVLESIGKNYTVSQAFQTICMAKQIIGFVEVSFILGFPFENLDQYRDTVYFMKRCYQLDCRVKNYYLTPFPSTVLYKKYAKKLKRDNQFLNLSIRTPSLDNKEIQDFFDQFPYFSIPFSYYHHEELMQKHQLFLDYEAELGCDSKMN